MTPSILVVCSYNQVRSVMAQLLLQRALHDEGRRAVVRSAGFAAGGRPAMPEAIRAMRNERLDATGHISTQVDADMVQAADLVLTAERLHVIRLVEDDGALFKKVFTLPEFANLAAIAGARGDRTMAEWLTAVGAGRTHATFLAAPTPEVDDPTGMAPAMFTATATRLDAWCRTIAALL